RMASQLSIRKRANTNDMSRGPKLAPFMTGFTGPIARSTRRSSTSLRPSMDKAENSWRHEGSDHGNPAGEQLFQSASFGTWPLEEKRLGAGDPGGSRRAEGRRMRGRRDDRGSRRVARAGGDRVRPSLLCAERGAGRSGSSGGFLAAPVAGDRGEPAA